MTIRLRASVFSGPIARRKRAVTAADVSLTGVVFKEGFSRSLAIDDLVGDGRPDLVVGAPRAPVGSEGPGYAYVFVAPLDRGSRSASPVDRIVEGAQISDGFGIAVATGNLTGDSQANLAVGADELFRRGIAGRGPMSSAGRSRPVSRRRRMPTPGSSANPLTEQ